MLALEHIMNPYWPWNLSWTLTAFWNYHEPILILESNINPYQTYHELIPVLKLKLNPYRCWNYPWHHISPKTESKPIKDLELMLEPYQSWNRSWTHIELEIAPDFIYFQYLYLEPSLYRIGNDIWTWFGYVSDTITILVDKPYPVVNVQCRN